MTEEQFALHMEGFARVIAAIDVMIDRLDANTEAGPTMTARLMPRSLISLLDEIDAHLSRLDGFPYKTHDANWYAAQAHYFRHREWIIEGLRIQQREKTA